MAKKNVTRVNLTLSECVAEQLDFVSRVKYGDIPRATLVNIIIRRFLDDEMANLSYTLQSDGKYYTIDESERLGLL